MRVRLRDYELMFIISPLQASEEQVAATIDRVQQAVAAAGGTLTDVDHSPPWGRRKFAYPIRRYAEGEASRRSFNEGYYVLCHLQMPTEQIGELERALKLNDAILRYLFTLVEKRTQLVDGAARPVYAQDDAEGDEVGNDEEDLDEDYDEDEGEGEGDDNDDR